MTSPYFEPRAAAITKNGGTPMMDQVRRALLTTGAAMAAAPRVSLSQAGQEKLP
jgi:hypothetical protein